MKTNQQIAIEVIAGKWGVGQQRRDQLQSAGYDPTAVQSIVNALMSGKDLPLEERVLTVELDLNKYDGIKVVFT